MRIPIAQQSERPRTPQPSKSTRYMNTPPPHNRSISAPVPKVQTAQKVPSSALLSKKTRSGTLQNVKTAPQCNTSSEASRGHGAASNAAANSLTVQQGDTAEIGNAETENVEKGDEETEDEEKDDPAESTSVNYITLLQTPTQQPAIPRVRSTATSPGSALLASLDEPFPEPSRSRPPKTPSPSPRSEKSLSPALAPTLALANFDFDFDSGNAL
jgi:hypothetical protein